MTDYRAGEALDLVQTPERRRRLGLIVAHTLLLAVEARARVEEFQLKLEHSAKPTRVGTIVMSHEVRRANHILLHNMNTLEEKLAWRERETAGVIDARPSLHIVDIIEQTLVAEGRLKSVDLEAATVAVDNGELETVVPFATPLPIPEGFEQQYGGHVLIVDFEVVAVNPAHNWAFL